MTAIRKVTLQITHCQFVTNLTTDYTFSIDRFGLNLNCSGSDISSIDLSHNTALTFLNIRDNKLSAIDLAPLTKMRSLYIDGNQLASVDVSKLTAMTTFWCNGNQLESLDISQNVALTTLVCHSNALKTLDVSKNTKLTTINAHDNQLNSIDLTQNTRVSSLDLSNNGRVVAADKSTDANGNSVYYIPTADIEARISDGFKMSNVVDGSWTGAKIANIDGAEALVLDADTVTYQYSTGYTGTRDAVKTAKFYFTYGKVVSGIDQATSSQACKVYAGRGCIYVDCPSAFSVSVLDFAGREIYRGADGTIAVHPGAYIVKAGSYVSKVMVY